MSGHKIILLKQHGSYKNKGLVQTQRLLKRIFRISRCLKPKNLSKFFFRYWQISLKCFCYKILFLENLLYFYCKNLKSHLLTLYPVSVRGWWTTKSISLTLEWHFLFHFPRTLLYQLSIMIWGNILTDNNWIPSRIVQTFDIIVFH